MERRCVVNLWKSEFQKFKVKETKMKKALTPSYVAKYGHTRDERHSNLLCASPRRSVRDKVHDVIMDAWRDVRMAVDNVWFFLTRYR